MSRRLWFQSSWVVSWKSKETRQTLSVGVLFMRIKECVVVLFE